MSLSSPLRKVASKLMAKFGGVVTIRRITMGAYDPATGTAAETAADTAVRGVLEDVNLREVNDLIQAGDKRLTIAAADVANAPTPDEAAVAASSSSVADEETEEFDTCGELVASMRLRNLFGR